VLRYEAGSLVELARWLGMPYQSVRHLFVPRRPISIETALRVARVARVSLAEVLGARWVATARCPLCGRSG
jgi:plasmid maintenance system antidote protein VapI